MPYRSIKIIILFFIYLIPAITFAFGGGETPVGNGIGYIIDALTGTTGKAIATLSVMCVGLACLGHYVKWTIFFVVIVGVAIIFGAQLIVEGITQYVR